MAPEQVLDVAESKAWDWLDSVTHEEAADLLYSADEMVDAYIAGYTAALALAVSRTESPDQCDPT